MIEVVVHFETGRSNLLNGSGLFVHVVIGTGVDFKDHIPFFHGSLNLFGQVFRGGWAGPGSYGYAVAYFLTHEFVRGNFKVFAHGIVESTHQAAVEIGVDKVKRIAVDQVFYSRFERGLAACITIADNAIVSRNFKNGTMVYVEKPGFLIGIPVGDFGVDGDDVDVDDFHDRILF